MDELKKLLAAATPGPWSEQDGSIGRFVKGRYEWSSIADVETAPDRDAAEGEGRANALLICAAVNALPELLAKVKRYENLIRAMIENEPDDIVADGGHTVLDEWRYNARAALKETKP